jgi:hypothetical protein
VGLLALSLGACDLTGALTRKNLNTMEREASRPRVSSTPFMCGTTDQGVRTKGGEQSVPVVLNSPNFGGYFAYGPMSKKHKSRSVVVSCSDNYYGIPVPKGYSPDWFGEWDPCFDKSCNSLGFGGTGLVGEIQSSTWLPGVQYFMFLYTIGSAQFIESYPIGPLSTKKRNPGVLSFSSPFQNGFVYPSNDEVGLEIVHQSP